mmetsp:Transcript_7235/g.16241  ORF Transcript_7235/g.16241 Transcript_7235/m.16241 type:complete len:101 (+) Transcript_7235:224-526(+)
MHKTCFNVIHDVLVVIDPPERRARGRSSSRFEKLFLSVLLVYAHIVASVELMTLSIFKMVGHDMDSHFYDFSCKNSPLGAREVRVWSRCYKLRVLYQLGN